jgi:hypothetical protein
MILLNESPLKSMLVSTYCQPHVYYGWNDVCRGGNCEFRRVMSIFSAGNPLRGVSNGRFIAAKGQLSLQNQNPLFPGINYSFIQKADSFRQGKR